MQRIVIVGGGVGGTMLANLLVVRLYPEILGGEVQVLLISDSPDHYTSRPSCTSPSSNSSSKI